MGTLRLGLNEPAPEEKPGCLSPAQCHPTADTPLPCPKLVLHHTTCNSDTEVTVTRRSVTRGWPGALHSSAALGGRAMPVICAMEGAKVP